MIFSPNDAAWRVEVPFWIYYRLIHIKWSKLDQNSFAQFDWHAHAPKLLNRFSYILHHSTRLGLKRCRFGFFAIGPAQVDQIGPKPSKIVTGTPMLRNYWTDFDELYTIRHVLVWNGAVLSFIPIRLIEGPQGAKMRPTCMGRLLSAARF